MKDAVRERYARAAQRFAGEPRQDVPSLGVGDPVAVAAPQPGETVLDLGSGPGRDLVAAATAVGPSGRAVGVDMTSEMIELARAAASDAGLRNVSVVAGELEHLPLPCASVDVVISNCVINLTDDKRRALVEAYRALVPGGRLAIVDTAWDTDPGEDVRNDPESWSCCVGGALVADDYVALLSDIGFADVALTKLDATCGDACSNEVGSVAVTAVKPGERPASAVRPAVPAERDAITALLAAAELPTDVAIEDALVLHEDATLIGVVAVERYGRAAYLRSLAVREDARGRGSGTRLTIAALEVARWSGADEVYLATPGGAQTLFERLGFAPVSRKRAQDGCAAPQLRSDACADAFAMRLAFEDADLPLLGRPSRKPLPTFQDGACC